MSPPPASLQCISLILCDDIFRDEVSKKLVIVGTFHMINAPVLPYELPRMAILATLTGGHGEHDVALAIQHEKTGNEVVRIGGPLTLPNPVGLADIDLRLDNVKFDDAGKYWVMLMDRGEIINQRPFLVRLAPQEEGVNERSGPAV